MFDFRLFSYIFNEGIYHMLQYIYKLHLLNSHIFHIFDRYTPFTVQPPLPLLLCALTVPLTMLCVHNA